MTFRHPVSSVVLVCMTVLLGLCACKPAAEDGAMPAGAPAASTTQKMVAAADAVNPLTSPREEVIAAMRKFMDATSYHASMEIDGGAQGKLRNEVDFVAPDRMRMQMAGMGTQLVIGDTMHMSMEGRTMQVPMPKGTLTKWRDPANFKEAEAGMTAKALGSETVDGVPARKYAMHYSVPDATDATLWIGADGLPLKMQVTGQAEGKQVTTSIRYSRINDPSIRIDAPK